MRLTIHETQNEYENDESINPALLWDMIKLKIREKSLSFAAAKKRKTLYKQHELEEKIALLEKKTGTADCRQQNAGNKQNRTT